MKISRVLAFIAAASVAVTFVATAAANHSWGRYHWERAANPFTLQLGDNVSGAWDSYLGEASFDWSLSEVLDTGVVAGETNGTTCSPTSGRIEVCSAAYGTTGWLGLAQIWVARGSHITQAVTKVNDTYFDTATYNTPAWRRLVMCQEIGHDFGLDHQDENFSNTNLGSCMDYTNDPDGGGSYGPSNEHPNAHDYEQLATIYSHADGGSKGKGKPNGQGNGNSDPPGLTELAGNAPPFSQASRANGVRYFDDLGNGQHLITFVFWTLD